MRRDGTYDIKLDNGEIRKSIPAVKVREAIGPRSSGGAESLSLDGSLDAISPPTSPEEAAPAPVQSLSLPSHVFVMGDTVEANWRGLGQYHMGVITGTLDDGTFRVAYTDGDSENGVPARYIRRVQTRRRAAAAPAAAAPAKRPPLKPLNKVRAPQRYLLSRLLSAHPARVFSQRKNEIQRPDSPRIQKKHVPDAAASADAACCDSGPPVDVTKQLQIWQGQGPILKAEALPDRRSSIASQDFHDVYGSTLSPRRQNESTGGGASGINIPGVLSETPYYYRKQERFEAEENYRKTRKTPAEIASEVRRRAYVGLPLRAFADSSARVQVDYELDLQDEQWLKRLNDAEKGRNNWAMFLEEDMEVLIDRYEKADAALHKLAGHSAVRTEVLLLERPAVSDVRGVSTMVQEQVYEWWTEKRNQRGEQLLRRLRAPPDTTDEDDDKAFRRVSEFGTRRESFLQAAPGLASPATQHQVGDIVEANYRGRGKYFGGIIAAVNPNGSFAVKYHDGDCESQVPSCFIRKMSSRRRMPAPQTPATAEAMQERSAGAAPAIKVEPAAAAQPVAKPVPAQLQAPPSPKAVGDIIEANYQGLGKYYTGSIAAINPNGTYKVKYHDGDCEDEVPNFDVRRLPTRRRKSASEPTVPSAAAPKPQQPAHNPSGPAPQAKAESGPKPASERKRVPREPKKDENIISKKQASQLRTGDRVMLQWDQPDDVDHGKWFACTVMSDGPTWYEIEFDTFTVTNAGGWNLPLYASKDRLRRAATTASARIRRGAGPVLEWSRHMGGTVMPAHEVTPRKPTPAAPAPAPTPIPTPQEVQAESPEDAAALSPKAVGDIVEANYRGRGRYYTGTVSAVDAEAGTYRIKYDDGDSEDGVKASHVRRLSSRRRTASESSVGPAAAPSAKRVKRASSAPTPRVSSSEADEASSDGGWAALWAELKKVGWREDTFVDGTKLYFTPGGGKKKGQPVFLDSQLAVYRYLARCSK
eukprot:COSAG04_NODE_1656_length_6039_cov_1361.503095_3_plen_983_part_00